MGGRREAIYDYVDNYLSKQCLIKVDDVLIQKYCNIASYFNRMTSESQIVYFSKGSYEASYISRDYLDNDLDFIINLLVDHSCGHHFMNANKRTASRVFTFFLNNYTPYRIGNRPIYNRLQTDLVNKTINKETFINKLKEGLTIRMIKPNENVKLEKLIKRGYVTGELENKGQRANQIRIQELKKDDVFFKQFRKPYFQRDTNQWSVERIEKLIESFLDDMLIPAVILWNSEKDGIFIVDGAHRLSALSAWVNDDYGKDIDILRHTQIKHYIDSKFKPFAEIVASDDPNDQVYLNRIASKVIPINWINGDYELVKKSFLRINEQGVELKPDEKELIRNDKYPTSILSRSILSFIGGQANHKSDDERIKDIYEMLFQPTYDKSSNIFSMGGMIYDDYIIGRIYNLVKIIDNEKNLELNDLIDKTKKILDIMVNDLELNNRIYYYGTTHMYKESALNGMTSFILEYTEKNKIDDFLSVRGKFEKYLINNPKHIQDIVRKSRQVNKAVKYIVKYYNCVIQFCKTDDEDIIYNKFHYLGRVKSKTEREKLISKNYQMEIEALTKCPRCGGFINNHSSNEVHNCCSVR